MRRERVSFGCLPLIITMFVLWALFFGVTVNGKHYGVSCSCSDGVSVGASP